MISLFEVTVLLLCIAVSGLHNLQPVLDYLRAISPRNPTVSATAGAVMLLALCIAYLAGIILVHLLIIAPAVPPALLSRVALRLFSAFSCVLLLLAIMALVPQL
ncbi:unnamed protein product [Urochloa humidicola]